MSGRVTYYGGIVKDGLVLDLDAGKKDSYPRTGTTWNDISGNGNNGTLVNGPSFSFENGGSIGFDGVNDCVKIPDFNYGRSSCTVAAWVRYNSSSTAYGEGIVSKWQTGAGTNNEFILTSNNNSNLAPYYPSFYILNANNLIVTVTDTTTIMVLGTWYYLVGIFNGTNAKIYLNGVLKNTSANSTSPTIKTVSSQPIGIASFGSTFQYNSVCSVPQASIYNRALSASEVLQNYNATKSRYGL